MPIPIKPLVSVLRTVGTEAMRPRKALGGHSLASLGLEAGLEVGREVAQRRKERPRTPAVPRAHSSAPHHRAVKTAARPDAAATHQQIAQRTSAGGPLFNETVQEPGDPDAPAAKAAE